MPTAVAKVLSKAGAVTSDEYFHFLVQSFTDKSPAFEHWSNDLPVRFPLLFSAKYLLAKCAISISDATPIMEVIGAYGSTTLTGEEDQGTFIQLIQKSAGFQSFAKNHGTNDQLRQARESLQVISQISYFHLEKAGITLALDPEDAKDIFVNLQPISGERANNRDDEIVRLAQLFKDGSTQDFFNYPNTILTDVVDSGFKEGSKVKKTHVIIERNRELRKAFFKANPGAVCDFCSLDTKATYHWTEGVLDLHHLLPLASGTNVVSIGNSPAKTTLADLVPVCPSCHRAIHRYYDDWMSQELKEDFADVAQAKAVYEIAKSSYGGPIYV